MRELKLSLGDLVLLAVVVGVGTPPWVAKVTGLSDPTVVVFCFGFDGTSDPGVVKPRDSWDTVLGFKCDMARCKFGSL